MAFYTFKCPHCYSFVVVNKKELACNVFRHGVLKSDYSQISPHLSKAECDELKRRDLIFGCGKPFTLNLKKNRVEKCGYI